MANRAGGEPVAAAEIREIERTGECDLSDRELTALPPEIGQLTNLKQLWLNDNQLTAVPLEITQIARLLALWLNGNRSPRCRRRSGGSPVSRCSGSAPIS